MKTLALALLVLVGLAGSAHASCQDRASVGDMITNAGGNAQSILVYDATVTLHACVGDLCGDLIVIDSDQDGFADTNVLTGTPPQMGVQRLVVAGHLKITVTAVGANGIVQLCTTN